MNNLHIRPLQAGDEAHWRRLWSLYLEYYETSVDEDVYRSSFSRMLSAKENEFHGFIALLDDRPVGIAHFLFHRHGWRIENVCYLQDLYVDADVRGKSIGRALIEAVYRRADEVGCPQVYWHTQHFNEAGRKLYDKLADLTPFLMYSRPRDT